MQLPKGEFWFEAPKSLEEAQAIRDALHNAGVYDAGLVTRCWGRAADFRVKFNHEGEQEMYWNSTLGFGSLPPTKVVFTFKRVPQLDCTIEEGTKWESPQVGSRWEGGINGATYILANMSPDGQVCLINLDNGARYHKNIKPECINKITEEEWKQLTDGDEFVRVK